MIRFIAAIDEKLGLADEHGIPWMGKLPTDLEFFRQKTSVGDILMGYGTYIEFKKPFHNHLNYVAVKGDIELHPGFKQVSDARMFLSNFDNDIWVLGGAGLFTSTLDLADELYLTRIEADFHCTKFFPPFENDFVLSQKGDDQIENSITFRFEVWKPKSAIATE